MKANRLAWVSSIAGLGMLAVGVGMYAREKKMFAGLGQSRQAPVIDSYTSASGMKTVLRSRPGLSLDERLATIQQLVAKSVQDPEMRKLGLSITAKCPERDVMCEGKAIYDAIKNRIRYTGDIGPIMQADGTVDGIDLYQSARRTWFDMKGGDCDDQAILGATLLAVNGLTPVLRVVKEKRGGDWVHIFTGFTDTGRFTAIDTTVPSANFFGKEPPYKVHKDYPA